MNDLNKYKLKKKIAGIKKLVWGSLVSCSKLVVFLFFLITAIVFWNNLSIQLFQEFQIDFSNQIGKMILIVSLLVIVIAIDMLKNLKTKK